MVKLAPSILSADFSHLAEDVAKAEAAGADIIHVDVMDGHFVPNISFGASVMKSLEGKTGLTFDVHLMIETPDRYIDDFITETTEYITVHAEACKHINRTLQHIKTAGAKAGVALNPGTSLSVLDYALEDVDMVLVMSVNPGFGGQAFISSALEKIKALAALRKQRQLDFEIEIDGGVTLENVEAITDAGADIIVAGSSVFKTGDIEKSVKRFKDLLS